MVAALIVYAGIGAVCSVMIDAIEWAVGRIGR